MVILTQSCDYQKIECPISSYHPCGMLDRDQRTTKHLPKFSNKYSEIPTMKILSKNQKCYREMLNSQNQRATTSVADSTTVVVAGTVAATTKQNQSVLTSNCSSKSQNSHNNLFYYQLATQNRVADCKSTSCKKQIDDGHYKSSKSSSLSSSSSCCSFPKLSNLLICICFWLLILQRTRAMPVSPTCRVYKEAIKMILKQAQMSYEENERIFNEFTTEYFKENHLKLLPTWLDSSIKSLKPREGTVQRLKEPQYYDHTEPDVVAHLQRKVTTEIIHNELKELYERLLILDDAFEYITDQNEGNTVDQFNQYYYDKHRQYLKNLKVETEDGLEKLNIEKPEHTKPDLKKFDSRELRDYIVMREHMILLKYIKDAYVILSADCPIEP